MYNLLVTVNKLDSASTGVFYVQVRYVPSSSLFNGLNNLSFCAQTACQVTGP